MVPISSSVVLDSKYSTKLFNRTTAAFLAKGENGGTISLSIVWNVEEKYGWKFAHGFFK